MNKEQIRSTIAAVSVAIPLGLGASAAVSWYTAENLQHVVTDLEASGASPHIIEAAQDRADEKQRYAVQVGAVALVGGTLVAGVYVWPRRGKGSDGA